MNDRKEIEVKLMALIHGELSEQEANQLLERINNDPELDALYQELLLTSTMVKKAVAPSEKWKMEDGMRANLLATLKGEKAAEETQQKQKSENVKNSIPWRQVTGIAASVAVTLVVAGEVFEINPLRQLARVDSFKSRNEPFVSYNDDSSIVLADESALSAPVSKKPSSRFAKSKDMDLDGFSAPEEFAELEEQEVIRDVVKRRPSSSSSATFPEVEVDVETLTAAFGNAGGFGDGFGTGFGGGGNGLEGKDSNVDVFQGQIAMRSDKNELGLEAIKKDDKELFSSLDTTVHRFVDAEHLVKKELIPGDKAKDLGEAASLLEELTNEGAGKSSQNGRGNLPAVGELRVAGKLFDRVDGDESASFQGFVDYGRSIGQSAPGEKFAKNGKTPETKTSFESRASDSYELDMATGKGKGFSLEAPNVDLDGVDDMVGMVSGERDEKDFSKQLEFAKKEIRQGDGKKAKEILEGILPLDPGNPDARIELDYAYDPIRTNPSVNKEYTAKLDKVKADYDKASYDETRARILTEVDRAWEIVPTPVVEANEELSKAKPARVSKPTVPKQENQKLGYKDLANFGKLSRADSVKVAEKLKDEAIEAYSKGDFESSIEKNREALGLLAQGKVMDGRRKELMIALAKAEHAQEVAQEKKKYEERKMQQMPVQPTHQIKNLNDETTAQSEPFSTFSLHVSDVSFKLAEKELLGKGIMPDRNKIRPEEFLNAFDYGDPSVKGDDKVACFLDQAVHPFMQQRNLMRVSMSTAALGRSQPLRLTILLDNSGSMEREDREASVLKAMEVLVAQLQPQDEVSLISFAHQPRVIAEGLKGAQLSQLVQMVKQAPSEGGTNIEKALQVAGELTKRHQKDGCMSRIVLMTDGAANLGNAKPEELSQMVIGLRQQGIAFDACGVGAEKLDDTILEALARKGDGRYYLLNSAEDADAGFVKQLAGALRPAASNVKVQVKFNPQRVKNYKLLGFEKHLLKKEDFRNDAVDAAELAAQEAGSAMYQFQAVPGGKGDVGEVFVRFKDMNTGEMVERSWVIPYVSQPATLENAEPSMQLATTAAMVAEKIRNTDVGLVDFSDYGTVLGNLDDHFGENKRVQSLIQMVRKFSNQ